VLKEEVGVERWCGADVEGRKEEEVGAVGRALFMHFSDSKFCIHLAAASPGSDGVAGAKELMCRQKVTCRFAVDPLGGHPKHFTRAS
jgi:hypothetical protein